MGGYNSGRRGGLPTVESGLSLDLARLIRQGTVRPAPRLRTGKKATQRSVRQIDPADTDAQRSRRASVNRILTVLKAGLNHARQESRVHSDEAWKTVKPFRDADAPKNRYLTDAEASRLTNAAPTDLREIVTAGLLTGSDHCCTSIGRARVRRKLARL